MKSVELLTTTANTGPWPLRPWKSQPLAREMQTFTGTLPDGAAACFASATDSRGCVVSTEWLPVS